MALPFAIKLRVISIRKIVKLRFDTPGFIFELPCTKQEVPKNAIALLVSDYTVSQGWKLIMWIVVGTVGRVQLIGNIP